MALLFPCKNRSFFCLCSAVNPCLSCLVSRDFVLQALLFSFYRCYCYAATETELRFVQGMSALETYSVHFV